MNRGFGPKPIKENKMFDTMKPVRDLTEPEIRTLIESHVILLSLGAYSETLDAVFESLRDWKPEIFYKLCVEYDL